MSRNSPMKQICLVAAATCCCALLNVPAVAETCEQRYPGSCRLEVSSTIVRTKGEPAAVATPRLSRRVKSARKSLAAGVRLAAIPSVPLPSPSPRRMTALSANKPTTVVDEAFNSLTVSDSTDSALEAALISRRNHFFESMLR
jgi:hypothetical protein